MAVGKATGEPQVGLSVWKWYAVIDTEKRKSFVLNWYPSHP